MESALYRYADHAALQPWQSPAPDEVLMEKEEPGDEPPRRAWLQEALLAFLFADEVPEHWEAVAVRALAIFRHCLPELLVGRDLGEVAALVRRVQVAREFELGEFLRISQQEDWREPLAGIMGYLFPAGRRWLYKGCIRTYLVAKTYQPKLLVRADLAASERHGMSFQELAMIFERESMRTPAQRAGARARWSARVKFLIRLPIEEAGGRSGLQFSKSSAARGKMAASARGNSNRKKKGCHAPGEKGKDHE